MFGTDEKHPVDPPAYSESKGSTSGILSDTSHGVALSIQIPPAGYCVPGSNLNARLSIPPDVLSGIIGEVECRLEGKSSVEIMGRPRYQKAQLLNAGMGGSAMPITGREEHLFALTTSNSSPQGEMTISLSIPNKRTCNCSHNSNVDYNRETGEEESGIMPSFRTEGSLGGDRVTWKLKCEFKRKGVLKRDIKLSIELPISLSAPSSSKSPLVSTASKPLTNGTNLEAKFTVLPSPSTPPQRIPFQLYLNSPSIPSSPTDLMISVGLCRHTWTKGIDTSLGSPEGHDFAGIIVGSLTPGISRLQPGNIEIRDDGKGLVVDGEYQVGEGMASVRGCGLRVSWSLQAQVRCRELTAPLVISQTIHLPHYIFSS